MILDGQSIHDILGFSVWRPPAHGAQIEVDAAIALGAVDHAGAGHHEVRGGNAWQYT